MTEGVPTPKQYHVTGAKRLLTFLFFSCKFFELFGLEWKGKTVLLALRSKMGRENSSPSFSLKWEGKTVLCTFDLMLESKKILLAFRLVRKIGKYSFSFLVDSPLVQVLGIRKWFLNFILNYRDSALGIQNQKEIFSSENLGLKIFSSGNSESEKKHKFHNELLYYKFYFSFFLSLLETF
ncbi:hypothetical protein C1645_743642 [Glomus cerebriforme]|uniref:Uncharacterized protein n=1 Tax=Glomus cerebriforme TaxID=658196 RepID=A0A397S9I7_9GLOM|nr:hypothetical protein C1645_743642 [Glomus cerebriforme]